MILRVYIIWVAWHGKMNWKSYVWMVYSSKSFKKLNYFNNNAHYLWLIITVGKDCIFNEIELEKYSWNYSHNDKLHNQLW